jgi:hypothetical protein
MPRHTGQTWVFGGASKYAALQPQNILLWDAIWAWTSSPMTGSYATLAAVAFATVLTHFREGT